MTTFFTIGHGTLPAVDFTAHLRAAGVSRIVDVRSAPGSRRHPHFGRAAMEVWLPEAGVTYRWEPRLGGFRRPSPDSPNAGLRHPAFRGYADHMATADFATALDGVLREAEATPLAVMCSETLWWRCHRRLLSDAAVLVHGARVLHVMGDARLEEHRLTEGATLEPGIVRYPFAQRGEG